METNYSRWKPILLVCRFSDPYFYFFFRRSPFSAYDDHSTSSLSPPLSTPWALPLPPLRFTASVKPTTPLYLLPFSTKQISKSSSIFSLFSDRNFLDMDEKFAISLGWTAAFPSPSFNLSLLCPVGDHLTEF
jgi:hypothetical protein